MLPPRWEYDLPQIPLNNADIELTDNEYDARWWRIGLFSMGLAQLLMEKIFKNGHAST